VLDDFVISISLFQDDATMRRAPIYFFKMQKVNVNNIVFTTAPVSGAVIKASYLTAYIPKDADHMLDLEITYSFMGS
jgi:hypothetical protein